MITFRDRRVDDSIIVTDCDAVASVYEYSAECTICGHRILGHLEHIEESSYRHMDKAHNYQVQVRGVNVPERIAEPYTIEAARFLDEELPGLDPVLRDLYLVLMLTIGESVTLRSVHDAWSVWCRNPSHPCLVPFAELSSADQAKDAPFAEGICRAAFRWRAACRLHHHLPGKTP